MIEDVIYGEMGIPTMIYFEDFPAGGRMLVLGYQTAFGLDQQEELESQLKEVVFAATPAFVLTDSEPVALILVGVKSDDATIVVQTGVLRAYALDWYNGEMSDEEYVESWYSAEELGLNLGE